MEGIQNRGFIARVPGLHVGALTDRDGQGEQVFVDDLKVVPDVLKAKSIDRLFLPVVTAKQCIGVGEVLERSTALSGIPMVVIRSAQTKDRIMRRTVWPEAGCVQVGYTAYWLDPATGNIVQTTSEEATSVTVGEPDPKYFNRGMGEYKEQSLNVAQLEYFQKRGDLKAQSDCLQKRMERVAKDGDPDYAIRHLPHDKQTQAVNRAQK